MTQDSTYILDKLRAIVMMYGPSIVLDLFQGACVLVIGFGLMPHPQRSGAARIARLLTAMGAPAPWMYLLFVRP